MAIYRHFGFPDLFITFTCNAKWAEIQHALSLIPRQRLEDQPDIIVRVFRIKVRHLIQDLMKNNHFGKAIGGKCKPFLFNSSCLCSINICHFFLYW